MSELPKRLYSGKVKINGKELGCAVLDDKTRVLTSTAVFEAFGRARKGKSLSDKRLENMPSFLDAKNLEPYINNVFSDGFDLEVKYTSKNGKVKYVGYNAEILPLICEVYLQADDDKVLTDSQKPLAIMSGILVRALSKVGITALIDEATGYEKDREEEELQKILAAYISAELLPWTKVFPDEFYKELYRLKQWEYNGHYHNSYVGKLTNFLIYHRLPDGVLDELKRLNPIIKGKNYRKNKLHQRLSKEYGYIQLRDLIYSDMALFRACDSWDELETMFRRSFAVPIDEKI
ncbi:MAG: phage-related protein [Anaerocolumna sp.]|nr:phage-related protein [Anaerocolumna sp.]